MTSDFKSERGVVDMIDSTGGEAAGSVTNEESSGRPCRCCFDVPRQPQQPAAENRCPDQKRTTTGGWKGVRAAGSGRTGGTHTKRLPRYKRPPTGNRPSTGGSAGSHGRRAGFNCTDGNAQWGPL